ncbi:MAG TPA: M28 family peptidase [Candidatus Angelobacter sp.]|nr:M28 family peptidase [Candidatus Angelobacter sp.]
MTHSKIFFKYLIVAVLALFAVNASGAPPDLPKVPASVESITPTELRMHLEFLASPELGGRYTLSPSFSIAARYLASRLKAYGFHGAGDHGDFLQSFEVISSRPDVAKTSLTVTLGGATTNHGFGEVYPSGGNGGAEGQVVFVGRGISSPSQHHDDYAGLDVKGKIVLLAPAARNVPGIDPSKLGDNESGPEAARAHGAVGFLALPPQQFAARMQSKDFQNLIAARESVRLAKSVEGRLPGLTVGPDVADKLLAPLGLTLKAVSEAKEFQPKAVDVTVRLVAGFQQERQKTQNVVGVLEGTDPNLKNEYVAFSAHYDHLKTNADGIYPGADDDGSGTTAILAIAHAISLERPKRSVMIIFHAGEELGLLGSEYNTDYSPAVPLSNLVVDLNIDMIGRSKPPADTDKADEHLTGPHTIYLVGADRISSELNRISESTNKDFQKLQLDYYYNDPNNPERIYFRSDHWNYAKHGIPIIFYFDGVHVDYHKHTDTVDKIDFNKMAEVTRLVFETGWRIANLDHRLVIAKN